MSTFQLFIGFSLGAIIGSAAWRTNALTREGAIAAAILGGFIFGLGGLPWAVLLIAFFVTSSGLSRFFLHQKARLDEKFSKGHQRDAGQVVANGGMGLVLILLQAAYPDQTWPWWGYAGALAAVNADTWATELGTLTTASPRLITTGRAVEKGTSGGITLAGTLAALAGAVLIGGVAAFFPAQAGGVSRIFFLFGTISLSGLAGSLVDSWLGATLQAMYTCPTCQKETERHPIHTCGTPTQRSRGLAWLNNDAVNFIASWVGATMAITLAVLF